MYKETEVLELKKSLSQLKEGVISMSAMLNKSGKRKVLFGINDDGKLCGLSIGKKTKADVAHEIHNNIKPLPVSVEINVLEIEGNSILEV